MSNKTTVLAAALISVGLAVGGTSMARAASETPDVLISGAIRCVDGKWSAISDDMHHPVGIGTVVDLGRYIRINHTELHPIGSMQIAADSDYARYGITAPGASVGATYSLVTFYKNGLPIKPSQACQPYTNLWITGLSVRTDG